jgi:hypothetical protein
LVEERGISGLSDLGDGRTCCGIACAAGNLDLVQYFIESCFENPERATPDGSTLLSIAARCGHLDIVVYLLSIGADPDKKNEKGYTPYDMAKKSGQDDVVAVLSRARKSLFARLFSCCLAPRRADGRTAPPRGGGGGRGRGGAAGRRVVAAPVHPQLIRRREEAKEAKRQRAAARAAAAPLATNANAGAGAAQGGGGDVGTLASVWTSMRTWVSRPVLPATGEVSPRAKRRHLSPPPATGLRDTTPTRSASTTDFSYAYGGHDGTTEVS